MLRRGCTLLLLLFGALFALYFFFFTRYFEWPGNLFAAGLGSLFGAMGLGCIGNLLWAWRDTAAFRRAARNQPLAHGTLVVVAGPIRPLGAPLTSPFGGRPCVAYEYEVVQRLPRRSGQTSSQNTDLAGFAMAASAIDTPDASVRLLGFPLLDQFPQSRDTGPDVAARARQYAGSAPFETMRGLGALQMFASFDDALADADGAVRKDFRMTEEAIPFERRTLGERIVGVGQEVCALGRYDAEKRRSSRAGRRSTASGPARRRRSAARSSRPPARRPCSAHVLRGEPRHARRGVLLSETRYAREPEARQASAIRSAIQDNDVAALERVIRQGANPNARDAFGDAVLLDVREPAMAAALVRLGTDVNVRDRRRRDTPLIRASRMGIVEPFASCWRRTRTCMRG